MLSKDIETALNEQIVHEGYASSYYLSMASWCEKSGLHGCAAFLYEQSEEERDHMMRLLRYINASGGHAKACAVKEPPYEYKSVGEVFELALEHEIHVTRLINRIVELCLKTKDFSSFHFLQWFVAEQHEEEKLFTSIRDLIKMTGTDGKGLYFIDTEISKVRERAMEEDSEDENEEDD